MSTSGSGSDSGEGAHQAADATASSAPPPAHATLTQVKMRATKFLPPPVVTAMAAFDAHPVIADNLAPLEPTELHARIACALHAHMQFAKLHARIIMTAY